MIWGKNFARLYDSLKITTLSIIILTSLFASVIPLQNAHADSITYPVVIGSNILTYRDITDTSPTPLATVSLNPSSAIAYTGQTVTISVNDFNENLDTTAVDFASATVSLTSGTSVIALTETGPDTQIFEGDFSATSQPTVTYNQEFLESPRASVTVDMATAGSITLSDVSSEASDGNLACNIRPVTDILEVEATSGTIDTTHTSVTISYANGLFIAGDTPTLLDMFYKKPGFGWAKVADHTFDPDGSSIDLVAKTVTSDPVDAGVLFQITEGQFVIGYDIGCGGGGGGGLVRPGLVVNALAGLSALGGGGSTPGPTIYLGAVAKSDSGSETISMPQEIRDLVNNHDPHTPLEPIADIYEDFDLPLSINGNGFALGGYENTIVTQSIKPGEPTEFKIVFYTNSEIAHTSLYFNLGPTRTIASSDTQVLLYKDKPAELIDPNGNIATATGSIDNEGDLKKVVIFSITFSNDIKWSNSDLIIRSWTDSLNSGDTIVFDAIQILPSEEEIAFNENIPKPEVEQLTSQHVPIWIKNNAAWWSQELIKDPDFVAGIEYLIQNKIITIQDNKIISSSYSSTEIPQWIKNTAGWWSEDLISEKEFIDGIQWLINNGIIQVTDT